MPIRVGFYAGSFDPFTLGHVDVIRQSLNIVDRLVIGIGVHHAKPGWMEPDIRAELIASSLAETSVADRFEITIFQGLAIEAARQSDAHVLVRGLRNASDMDYEFQMARTNYDLDETLQSVFVAASPAYQHVASGFVRQIAQMSGDISPFVPLPVAEYVRHHRA